LKERYIQNLLFASKQLDKPLPLRYVAGFLDFLITACGTQGHWVSELFKDAEFAKVITDSLINKNIRVLHNTPELKAFTQNLESKMVILLSELSAHKIGDAFLRKMAEGKDHERFYNGIVKNLLSDCH
jgi:hypothetical protein